LAHYSGDYAEVEVRKWVDVVLDFLKQPIKYEAVIKKYSAKKLMKASIFVQDYMKKTFGIEYPDINANTVPQH